MAGYSGTPLIQKIGIKPGHRIILRNHPSSFIKDLGKLPEGAQSADRLSGKANVIVYFITLGFTGTDLNVEGSPVSLGNSVQINVPDAGATARGVVTTGDQTFAGVKHFSPLVTVTGDVNITGDYRVNGVPIRLGRPLFRLGILTSTRMGTCYTTVMASALMVVRSA